MNGQWLYRIDWDILRTEVKVSTARSSGPGGQHVNKTQTNVMLRWKLSSSRALSEESKETLLSSPTIRARLNEAGELLIRNQESRSQDHNRQLAFSKLHTLLLEALKPRKKRKATRPTRSSKERRLNAKRLRSKVKGQRRTGGLAAS